MNNERDTLKNTLVNRDGITPEEAQSQINDVTSDIETIVSSCGSLTEVEDLLMDELGLEPDYLDEILFNMM